MCYIWTLVAGLKQIIRISSVRAFHVLQRLYSACCFRSPRQGSPDLESVESALLNLFFISEPCSRPMMSSSVILNVCSVCVQVGSLVCPWTLEALNLLPSLQSHQHCHAMEYGLWLSPLTPPPSLSLVLFCSLSLSLPSELKSTIYCKATQLLVLNSGVQLISQLLPAAVRFLLWCVWV